MHLMAVEVFSERPSIVTIRIHCAQKAQLR